MEDVDNDVDTSTTDTDKKRKSVDKALRKLLSGGSAGTGRETFSDTQDHFSTDRPLKKRMPSARTLFTFKDEPVPKEESSLAASPSRLAFDN